MINEDKMRVNPCSFLLLVMVVAIFGRLFASELKQKLKGATSSRCDIVAAMQGYDKGLKCYQEEIGVSW